MLIVIQKRILYAVAALLALVLLLPALPSQKAVLSVSAQADSAPVLVIDPGHGGEDGGAVAADGTKEAEINLAIAFRLRQLCFLAGIETAMTREDDISIHTGGDTIRARKASDIRARVELVNEISDPVLISIHQNSLPQAKSVHGAQVFFAGTTGSEELAALVQQRLNGSINRDRAKDHRVIDSSVYLMRHVQCPAILIECGFLSNEEETALLKTDAHQKKIALTAAAGYLAWESGGE